MSVLRVYFLSSGGILLAIFLIYVLIKLLHFNFAPMATTLAPSQLHSVEKSGIFDRLSSSFENLRHLMGRTLGRSTTSQELEFSVSQADADLAPEVDEEKKASQILRISADQFGVKLTYMEKRLKAFSKFLDTSDVKKFVKGKYDETKIPDETKRYFGEFLHIMNVMIREIPFEFTTNNGGVGDEFISVFIKNWTDLMRDFLRDPEYFIRSGKSRESTLSSLKSTEEFLFKHVKRTLAMYPQKSAILTYGSPLNFSMTLLVSPSTSLSRGRIMQLQNGPEQASPDLDLTLC